MLGLRDGVGEEPVRVGGEGEAEWERVWDRVCVGATVAVGVAVGEEGVAVGLRVREGGEGVPEGLEVAEGEPGESDQLQVAVMVTVTFTVPVLVPETEAVAVPELTVGVRPEALGPRVTVHVPETVGLRGLSDGAHVAVGLLLQVSVGLLSVDVGLRLLVGVKEEVSEA